MENATKALEMAASVLIGMLIIGALVFAYTQIHQTKQIEQDSLSSQQAVDFNKRFEAYNRSGLYGSELLSLANLIADYNNKEANDTKGYQQVKLTVNINPDRNAQVFTKQAYTGAELIECYNKLSKKIAEFNSVEYNGKQISYWANASMDEINANFSGTSPKEIKKKIAKYNKLVEEQTDIARKVFAQPTLEYDNNGRITKMVYSEK